MRRRRAIQFTPVLQGKDAIGNDVMAMSRAFTELGWESIVLAESVAESMKKVGRAVANPLKSLTFRADDLLICHHSIYSGSGEDLVRYAGCQTVVRYHNVTPGRFFAPYSQEYVEACNAGAEQTARLASVAGCQYLADSTFNMEDLISAGAPKERCFVLPPFHCIEDSARTPFHPPTLRHYKDGQANVLFVAGIKPNKGHVHAIRSFGEYMNDARRPGRLIFAGGTDARMEPYAEFLREVARQCGVLDRVVITGRVSESELRSLYMVADLFLCQSEHEGFCVPLVESMFFRVPIVACGVTAVSETVGDAGIVWSSQAPALFAESIDTCLNDPELCRELRWRGRERYSKCFRPEALKQRLQLFLESLE